MTLEKRETHARIAAHAMEEIDAQTLAAPVTKSKGTQDQSCCQPHSEIVPANIAEWAVVNLTTRLVIVEVTD